MKAKEQRYIYPPRPDGAVPRDQLSLLKPFQSWIAQLKFNDTRCLLKFLSDGRIQLWNRHGERIKNYSPAPEMVEELEALREKLGPGYHLLDGGVLDQKHKAIKDTIVVWDVLVSDGIHLIGTSYADRYGKIQALATDEEFTFKDRVFGHKITDNIFIPECIPSAKWDETWEMIDEINEVYLDAGFGPVLEGLVLKDPSAPLEFSFGQNNNGAWQVRSRVKTGRHNF
jgi:ATP-dependent DNA ligase